jgi:flagellar M-ring protein FliF
MSNLWQQLLKIWSRLEIAQRATIVLCTLGALALGGVLTFGATRPDYQLLARDLDRAKTAEIAAYLEQNRIPYEVVDRDTAVLVPGKFIYKLRNDLAQNDLLGDSSKGFELLDKGGWMESTFREHRTYDRAVAGELERSFREIAGVRGARVLIDRPAPSPFIDDEEGQPRASIKLDMKSSQRLTDRQIAGIIHLTVGAVASLDPKRVQVMDGNGLLTPDDADPGAQMAQTTLEAEMAREAYLTRKAQEQLDTILGPSRGRVKVAVKLDFTKRSSSTVDPTSKMLLSEHTNTSDKKTPVQQNGGVAGTQANVENEGRAAATPPQLASETKEEAQNSYFVGQRKETTEEEIGRIRGMTVSIILPFKEVEVDVLDPKGKPTGQKERKKLAYTADEQKRFESLVLAAIGFDAAKDIVAKSGDAQTLGTRFASSVQSMQLYEPPVETVAQAGATLPVALPGDPGTWIGYGLAGLVAVVLLMVARGQLKRSHAAWAEAESRANDATAAERAKKKAVEPDVDPDEEVKRVMKNRRNELKDNIKKAVIEDPNSAAQIVKRWLYES